tara:strand:+ start:1179 stop:1724 length:546 start_codon:yes stop_codon:yes gene_type:complete
MDTQNKWLALVAKEHKEWIKIVRSLGELDYAEDIVQEAYIALSKYSSKEKIIRNGLVNRGYMYFTLRSLTFQFYNKKRKINKVSLDNYNLEIPSQDNLEDKEAFEKLCNLIDQETENWHWYNKKLFNLYKDTDLSIRKIAAETKISWVSIFNTLKNCKQKIKDKHLEDWQDYKNEDYDKIR